MVVAAPVDRGVGFVMGKRRRWRRDCYGRSTKPTTIGMRCQRLLPFRGLPVEQVLPIRSRRFVLVVRRVVYSDAQLELEFRRFPRPRSTFARTPLNTEERKFRLELLREPLPPLPASRDECRVGVRPCPHVRCRCHLAIDVNDAGSIKHNFPDTPLNKLPATCAQDVADTGEHTLEQVAEYLNISPEGLRRFEWKIREKLKQIGSELGTSWLWDT